MNKLAIIKEHAELPDTYGIKLSFITGKTAEYTVAGHKFLPDNKLEFVTFEDEWHVVPLTNVIDLTFDKQFSKIVALKDTNGPK